MNPRSGAGTLDREGAIGAHRLVEVLSLEKLHDDVERAVFELTVQEDLSRVGMCQLTHGTRFAAESRDQVGAIGQAWDGGDLDRRPSGSWPAEAPGTPTSHATRAYLLENLELTVQDLASDERVLRRHESSGKWYHGSGRAIMVVQVVILEICRLCSRIRGLPPRVRRTQRGLPDAIAKAFGRLSRGAR